MSRKKGKNKVNGRRDRRGHKARGASARHEGKRASRGKSSHHRHRKEKYIRQELSGTPDHEELTYP